MESPLHLDYYLEVTKDNLNKQELLKILKHLKPTWKTEQLICKDLSGGFMNLILRCYLQSNPEDSVIVRIWSKVATDKLAKLIDRKMEVALQTRLGDLQITPKVFAIFKNGICCDYFDGETLLPSFCKTDEISRKIARNLAEVHAIHLEGFLLKSKPFLTFETALEVYPPEHPDPEKNKIFQKNIPSKDEALKEIKFLETFTKNLNLTVVQCHGDLHASNMMYNKNTGKVAFLDFEDATVGYHVDDITYYFLMLCLDYDNFGNTDFQMPEEDFQRKFLRWYLEKWFEIQDKDFKEVKEKEIERLFIQVNKYALVYYFYYAMICITFCKIEDKQEFHENLQTFDFYDFAVRYFRRYFEKKEELDSLKLP